jgi:hypothetical protein
VSDPEAPHPVCCDALFHVLHAQLLVHGWDGFALEHFPDGTLLTRIQYCPWCGAHIHDGMIPLVTTELPPKEPTP